MPGKKSDNKTVSESKKGKKSQETAKKAPKDAKVSKKRATKTVAKKGDGEGAKGVGKRRPPVKMTKFGPFNKTRLVNIFRLYLQANVPEAYEGKVQIQVQRNTADQLNSVSYPVLRDILALSKQLTVHARRATTTQDDVTTAFRLYQKSSKNPLLNPPHA